ncbi:DUF2281 domain-containing protein, partial [Geitlerinema sp. P-1104]|uniref:DUF2281 domain-containing protein n=1 Tax=Geitlerinema sp. P-1104 TaxID=2546230 RepID=UPI001476ACAD
MLTLETAIQKIKQFSSEQRNQVIQFIEFLDFAANQTTTVQESPSPEAEEAFFELAGIWEDKDITAESLRAKAWRET